MANLKSQMKRNRQTLVRQERNKVVRSRIRTYTRSFRQAADAGDRETAQTAYDVVSRELDKAASKRVIHRNTAANRKSGMAKRLASL